MTLCMLHPFKLCTLHSYSARWQVWSNSYWWPAHVCKFLTLTYHGGDGDVKLKCMDRANSWPATSIYWLEGKDKLCFRMINVGICTFRFSSLFCHRFLLEDLISLCLSSSHKTWPVFHRGAECISAPWKGRNLWDAQSTFCHLHRPLPQGVMASGYNRDCFPCPWNVVPQPGGEARSPSQAVKSSWKWAVPCCKTPLAPSHISGMGTTEQGETLWEAGASA